ncbi:hypothetical protein AMATHDRAFT_64018 [Amanita thiersii Skay4041]|uniref:Uncharacterized protein n=1 Tax=Amanita thiersii Skay4041 TaxID=703135 RepID=A0A2A9NMX2_9AGAR|nr:hypothetical protein AMATHDRAFT_64018 [Amanita thiersii Skay4041]
MVEICRGSPLTREVVPENIQRYSASEVPQRRPQGTDIGVGLQAPTLLRYYLAIEYAAAPSTCSYIYIYATEGRLGGAAF